jgi:hypothetical protein
MNPQRQTGPDAQKKPYSEPQLRVYGDIRRITQTSNVGANSDHKGQGSSNRTA